MHLDPRNELLSSQVAITEPPNIVKITKIFGYRARSTPQYSLDYSEELNSQTVILESVKNAALISNLKRKAECSLVCGCGIQETWYQQRKYSPVEFQTRPDFTKAKFFPGIMLSGVRSFRLC